ncbi:hypothetical protein ACHRVZ_17395 [Flavobacterium sp. FlaQc-57]|uniref:hypothetical protein n=1 Tax=Flavobacterium sp. FlaQc-57 TaxID=3374186 RepID=UPI003756B257
MKKFQRVDFLVNLKGFGRIIFDLKCGKKIKFFNSEGEYFSIFISELEELSVIQEDISLPLWISFSDKNLFNRGNKMVFYLVALVAIIKFWKDLSFWFDKVENYNEIKVLRIPDELLIRSEDSISLGEGQYQIDQNF